MNKRRRRRRKNLLPLIVSVIVLAALAGTAVLLLGPKDRGTGLGAESAEKRALTQDFIRNNRALLAELAAEMGSVPEGTMVREGEESPWPDVRAALEDTALGSIVMQEGCAIFVMDFSEDGAAEYGILYTPADPRGLAFISGEGEWIGTGAGWLRTDGREFTYIEEIMDGFHYLHRSRG